MRESIAIGDTSEQESRPCQFSSSVFVFHTALSRNSKQASSECFPAFTSQLGEGVEVLTPRLQRTTCPRENESSPGLSKSGCDTQKVRVPLCDEATL